MIVKYLQTWCGNIVSYRGRGERRWIKADILLKIKHNDTNNKLNLTSKFTGMSNTEIVVFEMPRNHNYDVMLNVRARGKLALTTPPFI